MSLNTSSLIQGPMAQMHDMHGSFVPYQRPCCSTCKRPSPCGGPCNAGTATCTTGTAGTVFNQVAPAPQPYTINPYLRASDTPGVSSVKLGTGYAPGTGFVGATPAQPVVPPNCNETLILCELLGTNPLHYLAYNNGDPVYKIPNQELLPGAYENLLNGFAPCTFDEHTYDGYCSCNGKCGEKCGGEKCKYKDSHFLITIESAKTSSELRTSNFALAANGIRERIIYLTRGKRYFFTFQPCHLSVDPRATIDGETNPNAGEPLPTSSGGVKVKETDIPLTFEGTSIIYTTNRSTLKAVSSGGPSQREPLQDTYPIPLFGTQWLYVGPQVPATFLISGYLDTAINSPPQVTLANELANATIQVVVVQPNTTKFPFPQ